MDTSSETERAIALLQKYKAGLCTPEEAARIQRWYDSFEGLQNDPDAGDIQNAADEAAYQTLIKLFGEKNTSLPGNKKNRFVYYFSRVAACLIIGCSVYLITGKLKRTGSPPVTYSQYSTKKGERKEIQLSDGSVVMLNVASILRVASDFGVKTRNVQLQGEAFFHVSKDKTRPFIIKTGKIYTRVVGTSFNINAYTDENMISVAVATGKVQVERDNGRRKTLIGSNLTHNHLLVYNLARNTCRQTLANVDSLAAWRVNKLVFDKASVQQIARVIERTYNVPVILIGKPQQPGLYTVTFDNTPLNRLLPLLANLTGITYEIKKQRLIINIQNCK